MAMKNCKECGAEISRSAKVCPKCGKRQKMSGCLVFIIIIILFGVIIGATSSGDNKSSISTSTNNYQKNSDVEINVIDFSTMPKEEIKLWFDTNKINGTILEEYSETLPKGTFASQSVAANTIIHEGDKITITYSLGKEPTMEEKNALKKAETYSNMMSMSKRGIYDQLTSEYGEKFPADAAQYAIDNLEADWNANALAKAKTYQSTMSMSKSAIYDQLTSEYGEKFTAEEAQYAIDHLED